LSDRATSERGSGSGNKPWLDATELFGLEAASLNKAAVPAERQARIDAGREVRKVVPRSSFAEWRPAANRADPISILEDQAKERVPELVPIRYSRMLASPFAFYRGAAAVMAADLAAEPTTGITAQACGDAHLMNFGAYAAPDRRLVFDLNDFDETLPAPFEWDLKRLCASIEIAGRSNGLGAQDCRAAVERAAEAYQAAARLLAGLRFLDAWYTRIDIERVLEVVQQSAEPENAKATEREVRKAQRRTNLRTLEKMTVIEDGRLRIREDRPLIERYSPADSEALEAIIQASLEDYAATLQPDRKMLFERYRLVDFARKVVGVGSVGTEAFMALMMGDRDDDPLFLQMKEAKTSVLAPFAGASKYSHQGERVVQGQRLMQAASDSFLGWVQGYGPRRLDYYVRQLRDMKGSIEVESLNAGRLLGYGELCAATLAKAHSRAGDAAAISGYVGSGPVFREALSEYSSRYADQNELDHALLVEAVASGRVEAAPALA